MSKDMLEAYRESELIAARVEACVPTHRTIVIEGERFETHGRGDAKTFKPIPWVHESINVWVNKRSPWVRQKLHDEWVAKIADVCDGMPAIHGQVIVTVWSFIGADRDCDPDNKTPKFIMDGLVEAGMIDGDGRRVVVDLRIRIRMDRERPRTEIDLRRPTATDLEDLRLDPVKPKKDGWDPLRNAARQLGLSV